MVVRATQKVQWGSGRSGFPIVMRLVWTKEVSPVSSSVKADKAFLSWGFFLFFPAMPREHKLRGGLCRLINYWTSWIRVN